MWKTIEKPGYFGKKRDQKYKEFNQTYGEDNWRLAYTWNNEIIDREFALKIYEDGFYEFLKNNPETLEWLIKTASDVYDTAESNAGSLDYNIQETPNNHIHDISIRRAVYRLGKAFQGDHLVHVRGEGTEGYRLMPGKIPFHLPQLIEQPQLEKWWWEPNTVEAFYQSNKVLQVKLN